MTALFSKLGCNGGTCHGTVPGQNGFRLSLFGADPLADRERLLREDGGRRITPDDPREAVIAWIAQRVGVGSTGVRTAELRTILECVDPTAGT